VTFLRYLTLLALALWIGGLVALGAAAAPQLFTVLAAQDPTSGRETAGMLFGAVLERFQYYVWGFAALLFFSLGIRAALGPRPRRFAVRMWTVSAMLVGSLVTGLYIAPSIDGIRREVPGPVASLPDSDPRRATFGRLHGASSLIMLLTVVAGAGLLWVEMKDPH
jgi:hypothetical protein